MTVQHPGRPPSEQHPVPPTFRADDVGGPAGGADWGRELAALTGPLAQLPGGLAAREQARTYRRRSRPPRPREAEPVPPPLPPSLGELDVRLLAEGRHETLWRALGARTLTHEGVEGTRFTLRAPEARAVRLVCGDRQYAMRALDGGVWEVFVPGVGDGARYAFEVTHDDGARTPCADPLARLLPSGAAADAPSATSLVHTSRHRWQDGEWLDRRAAGSPLTAPVSICALDPVTWRPGLGYRELVDELPFHVGRLGFTHVQFPAWSPQPGYAPDPRLGAPDDLRRLVDALHRAGVGVVLTWPAPSPVPDRPEERSLLIANALYWCDEFHVDGLHLPSLGATLAAPGGRGLVQELNATLHRRCPGVLTTSDVSADGVTRGTDQPGESGHGGLGFDFAWHPSWTRDALAYLRRPYAERPHADEELTRATRTFYAEHHLLAAPDGTFGGGADDAADPPGHLAALRALLAFLWAHPGKQLLAPDQEFVSPEGRDPATPGLHKLVRDLNSRYLTTPALWQLDTHPSGFAWVTDGRYGDAPVFALLRTSGTGEPLLSVSNFSPEPLEAHPVGVPSGPPAWREILNTDDLRYTGGGTGNPDPLPARPRPVHGRPAAVSPLLPPLSTLWFAPA